MTPTRPSSRRRGRRSLSRTTRPTSPSPGGSARLPARCPTTTCGWTTCRPRSGTASRPRPGPGPRLLLEPAPGPWPRPAAPSQGERTGGHAGRAHRRRTRPPPSGSSRPAEDRLVGGRGGGRRAGPGGDRGPRQQDDGGTTLAQAQLEPLPSAVPGTESAAATVVERDGVRELGPVARRAGDGRLLRGVAHRRGHRGHGVARAGAADGRYQIPPDVDVGVFPVVDVSIEPPDGVPTSGVSALRGTLT